MKPALDNMQKILQGVLALVLALFLAAIMLVIIPVKGVQSDVIMIFGAPTNDVSVNHVATHATIIADSVIRERDFEGESIGSTSVIRYEDAGAFKLVTFASDTQVAVKENRTLLNEVLRAQRAYYGPRFEILFDAVGNAYEVVRWPLVVLITAIASLIGLLISRFIFGMITARDSGVRESTTHKQSFAKHVEKELDASAYTYSDITKDEEIQQEKIRNWLVQGRDEKKLDPAMRILTRHDEEINQGTEEEVEEDGDWHHEQWDDEHEEGITQEQDVTPEEVKTPEVQIPEAAKKDPIVETVEEEDEISADDVKRIQEEAQKSFAKKASLPTIKRDKKQKFSNEVRESTAKVEEVAKKQEVHGAKKAVKKSAPGNLPVVDASAFGATPVEFDEKMKVEEPKEEEPKEKSPKLQMKSGLGRPVNFRSSASQQLKETKQKEATIEESVTEIGGEVPEPTDDELKERLNKLLRGEM